MKIKLNKAQKDFITHEAKFKLFMGGVGSGKTFIGCHNSILKIINEPQAIGLIAANTYRQLHNVVLQALFIELEKYELPFSYNQQKGILDVCGTKILCVSLENYDVLRGIEIGWFWIDEARDAKEEAFLVLMGRLRDRKAKKLEGFLTSTPFGFNYLYDYFYGEKKTRDFHLVESTSLQNPFLPQGYCESLKEIYSEKVYEQEVLGRIINLTSGRVYYSFKRESNVVDFERDANVPLVVGIDFNVSPLSGVIANYVNGVLYVFDEIFIESTNTHEVAEFIKSKYGTGHTVIPDSTGVALKTSSAGKSDHQILKEAGFIIPPVKNPSRRDRYNCVNSGLEKRKILFNNKVKKITRDLERLVYKEGTDIPDVSNDKMLGHISDALGYLYWYLEPSIKPQIKVRAYV